VRAKEKTDILINLKVVFIYRRIKKVEGQREEKKSH
jgi:hypothetical protein